MLTSGVLPGFPLIESPFFSVDVMFLDPKYREIAKNLNEDGFAVIDFPDLEFNEKAEAIKKALSQRYGWRNPSECAFQRAQDAWVFDENVRSLACNQGILDLLTALYGRQAFPFQTLNFPVGSQQGVHGDYLHFNSVPDRFMCGVWVALEDINEDNGPLFYIPGSHKWPTFQNEHLGVSYKDIGSGTALERYIELYDRLIESSGAERKTFTAKKGQALIWAANLLHGGSTHKDSAKSRWSQVTHYFFEGCGYTTPINNDVYQGVIQLRQATDLRDKSVKPNIISGELVLADMLEQQARMARVHASIRNSAFRKHKNLPRGFDPYLYIKLNPDVLELEFDPFQHYVSFGKAENRQWKDLTANKSWFQSVLSKILG